MEKEYEIINDTSLAEKEKKEVPASEEIKPDKVVEQEETTSEIELSPVEAQVTEEPAEAQTEITVPEMKVVSSTVPANDGIQFNSSETNSLINTTIEDKPVEVEKDKYIVNTLEDIILIKNEIKHKNEITIDEAFKIIEAAHSKLSEENHERKVWAEKVVVNGLNKPLFDEYEEIGNKYNQTDTTTYEKESNAIPVDFGSSQIDNVPTFGDQDNNTFGGIDLAA